MAKFRNCFKFWSFFIVLQVSAACQVSQAAKPGYKDFSELHTTDLEDDKVPMDLWSPARRKANASFYYMAGEHEALNRNMSKARKFLENAYNLDPNPFLSSKLIEAKAGESIEDALLLAKKMVLTYPKDSDTQLLYGRLLSEVGQLNKAEYHLRLSRNYNSKNLETHISFLQILQIEKKYREALEAANEMLRLHPDYTEGWMQLARLHLKLKQKKSALDASKKAYDIDRSDPEKVQLYAVMLDLNNENTKAIDLYETVLKLDPTNEDLIGRMVALYKQIGTLDEALKMLKRSEEKAGRDVLGIRLQMAFIYWEMQKFSEASDLLDQLAAKNPHMERIIYMAGVGQERTKQYDRAIKTYSGFDTSSEFYVHSRYRMIDIYKKAKRTEESLTIAHEVISSDVDRAVDFYPLAANIYSEDKRYTEAVKILDQGLQKYPDRFDFLFIRAISLEKLSKYEDCVSTLKALLDKDPEHAAARNYLGYLFAEKGINLEEAEFHIKKALEIRPDDGYYLDSLGWVYYQQGNFRKALDILLRANEQVPNEAVLLEHLAMTYEALENWDAAMEIYEKAILIKMEEADRVRIQEKYERIKAKDS